MPDVKISALTGASTPLASTEVLPIVQSGSTVQVSVANLTAGRAVSASSLANGLGAVGTPSYTFTGDTDTGMWSPAADTLAFSEGGAEVMRITSAGNVGIGTNAPDRKLDVQGSGSITVRSRSTDTSGATVGVLASEHASGSSLQVRAGVGFTNLISTGAADPLILSTNSAERLRIDSSGNVGIGSTPAVRFQITQDQAAYSYFDYYNNTNAGGIVWRQIVRNLANTGNTSVDFTKLISSGFALNNNDNNAANFTSFGVGGSERMRIDSSGNVGIGTTSPTVPLEVSGSIRAVSLLQRVDNSGLTLVGGTTFNTTGASLTLRGSTSAFNAHGMEFYAGGSERMRILTGGNVGIGTGTPSVALDVAGTIRSVRNNAEVRITTATGYGWRTGTTSTASTLGYMFFQATTDNFATSFIDSMAIDSAGKVGIGTTSPSYKLQVNASSGANQVAYFVNDSVGSTLGGIASSINSGGNNTNSFHFAGVTQTVALYYLYGNGTTSYTSDIRVKKNVTTTRDGYLEDVCNLRVVKYNWYNDSDDTPRELGFIAQEVEQVFPGLVQDAMHPTKDGEIHKVLKGSVLTPILLKALQEASAKIDALAARVTQLEVSAEQ